jgi:predicted porin
MKKSLLALAVFGAFAGAASAQSSVTMYGRVDLSIGKNSGTSAKYMANGSGSRLGLRGVEDLGGGMTALFNIEHRFNADTGAQTNAARFWTGRSIVGLQGGFGQVVLGREYTTSFLQSQLVADPWGFDTVVASTDGAGIPVPPTVSPTRFFGTGGTVGILTGGAIAKVRNDSSLTYRLSASGFTFGAQIAEASDAINNFQKKPFNFSLSYAGGPLTVGFGYEKTGREGAGPAAALLGGSSVSEKLTTINAAYNLGAVKLGVFIGNGDSWDTGSKHKSQMFTATAPLGAGEFRAAIGQLKLDNNAVDLKVNRMFGLGYHYSLSKRTTIYADVVNNNNQLAVDLPASVKAALGVTAPTSKTGYDVGLKHNF